MSRVADGTSRDTGVSNSHTKDLLLCEHWQVGRRNHMPRNMEALEGQMYSSKENVRRSGGTGQVGRVQLWSLNVMSKLRLVSPKPGNLSLLSRILLWKGK